MTNEVFWQGIPDREKTAANRSKAFCMFHRGACRMAMRYEDDTNYPNKLLATEFDRDLVDEVHEDARCSRRLDPFSQRFMKDFDGDIDNATAAAEIKCINEEWRDETVQIELTHSRFRKFVVGRSNQVACVDMNSTNQYMFGMKLEEQERRFKHLKPVSEVAAGEDNAGDKTAEGEDQDATTEVKANPKKRVRASSNWDMFRKRRCLGVPKKKQAKPQQMSTAYWSLSAEDQERLTDMAEENTYKKKENKSGNVTRRRQSVHEKRSSNAADGSSALNVMPSATSRISWEDVPALKAAQREAAAARRNRIKEDEVALLEHDKAGGCGAMEAEGIAAKFESMPEETGSEMKMGFPADTCQQITYSSATFACLKCKEKARALLALDSKGGNHAVAALRAVANAAWEECVFNCP